MKLFCAIVGDSGSVFEVDIDEGASVYALKKVITNDHPITIHGKAKDVQLFLAKKDKDKGAWLTKEEVAPLRDESVSQSFRLINTTLLLNSSLNFGEGFQPGEGQVQVLVFVPKIALKRPAEDEPTDSAILKRLKIMASELADIKAALAAIKPKTMTDFKTLCVKTSFDWTICLGHNRVAAQLSRHLACTSFGRDLANSPRTISFGWKKWCSGR
ncbi:hypothetical protein V7S43_017040 [Phytophthora oleae]|uniref:Crinkler effector protein N-terminal domain-containing protein n=1 Tax=Phytophthora oleae TaxID=2107226 RepID=A0ABD3EUY2_9STRA